MAQRPLPNVTLCAASDVAIEATIRALEQCLDQITCPETLFFSSLPIHRQTRHDIRHVPISPLASAAQYSDFILTDLAQHVSTDFALIVQWDGFIVDPQAWTDEFLNVDYIGAPWIHQPAGQDVGNGGFSLRSRRLLEMGSKPWFRCTHPEDLCLAQVNREQLELAGIRFADRTLARRFSREREPRLTDHFGIHGIFALAEQMAPAAFETLLESVEFGVIGKRELLDVIRICEKRQSGKSSAAARCRAEFLRRFPLDLHAPVFALKASLRSLIRPTE